MERAWRGHGEGMERRAAGWGGVGRAAAGSHTLNESLPASIACARVRIPSAPITCHNGVARQLIRAHQGPSRPVKAQRGASGGTAGARRTLSWSERILSDGRPHLRAHAVEPHARMHMGECVHMHMGMHMHTPLGHMHICTWASACTCTWACTWACTCTRR